MARRKQPLFPAPEAGPPPLPAFQMRVMLAEARGHGVPFDLAWGDKETCGIEGSWERIRWPHDTPHRSEWKAIMREQRLIWEAYYIGAEPSATGDFGELAVA